MRYPNRYPIIAFRTRDGACQRCLIALGIRAQRKIATMADKTLFQKIDEGVIPGDFVHRDERCFAIRDIDPKAPVHILIIPRKPIPSNDSVGQEDAALIGHLFVVAKEIAAAEGLGDGYRLVFNCGPNAGQAVPHLHLHLLGGRRMSWPPG